VHDELQALFCTILFIVTKTTLTEDPTYAFFTNFNEVQVNIAVTPSAATQINQFVNEILAGITLLLIHVS
jgi:hypothetical protein